MAGKECCLTANSRRSTFALPPVLSFERGGERHLALSLQPGGLSSYELECGGDAMELAGQTGELAMWLADVADVADYLRGEYPDAIVDV